MKKVFIVKQESCVNGEPLFKVNVCATLEIARQVMKKEIDTILDKSPKYAGAREEIEGKKVVGNDEFKFFDWDWYDDDFHIHCLYDAYYEHIEIEEKEILA